jgi:hypothetical protein
MMNLSHNAVGRGAPAVIAVAVMVALGVLCVAQYQVNTQLNNRVNPELYGGGTGGSMRYAMPQSQLLPSEARNATWRSGALPSDIRMNQLSVGPLAPSGSIAYVPGPSPLQQAMKLPQPQLYNPAYNIPAEAAGSKPISSGPITGQLPNGTIRYNSPAQPAPAEMLTAQQPSWTRPLPSAVPLPPITPGTATPQPAQINRPPVRAPDTAPSDSAASAAPFYLSHFTPGSIRYSGPTTQPAR